MRRVLIVFAVFVVINIAVLGWFFTTKNPGKLSPLFPYVSAQAEQTVLVRSDRLLALLGDNASAVSSNPLYSTRAQSNHIGLLQFGSGIVNQYSAILIDAKKWFVPQDFLALINIQDDTDYLYEKVSDTIFIFAQPNTLAQINSDSNTSIIQSEWFAIMKPLVAGKDVVFISRVDPNAAPIGDATVEAFISQTDSFVVTVAWQRGGLALDAHLLYKEPKELPTQTIFSPRLTSYIDNQTILYIESNMQGLWTDDDKVAIFSGMRAYDPVLFAQTDDATLDDIISSNAWLIVQNSPMFTDLRVALLLESAAAFPLIRSVFPLLQEPLAAMAGIDPMLIQAVEEASRVSYQATLFGLVPVTLQAYREQDASIVSLGANSILTKSNIHKASSGPDGSIGYVFVQFDPLLQLYKQFGAMAGQNVQDPFFVQQEQLLKGKTWAGHIVADENKVSLKSTIK
jgi:hypothetical protein